MASNAPTLTKNQGVLQDLLHVLSQPLTTLHCALEHSLEADQAAHSEEVALALEQTDRVIEAVRLMREYLEAEEGCFVAEPFPLGLAIENALEQLAVLAEARGVSLFACGASSVAIPVKGVWVQRALFYLFVLLLESAPTGGALVVVLEDGLSRSVISGHSLPANEFSDCAQPDAPRSNTLRQARIAIAQRVLGSSGGSVEFYSDEKPGFAVRIPRTQTGYRINLLTA